MADTAKAQENRLRRMASRQGFKLVKSKRRDPQAVDHGNWMVVNAQTNNVEAGGSCFFGIDDVEKFLTGEKPNREKSILNTLMIRGRPIGSYTAKEAMALAQELDREAALLKAVAKQ